jgi:hypothetical protein
MEETFFPHHNNYITYVYNSYPTFFSFKSSINMKVSSKILQNIAIAITMSAIACQSKEQVTTPSEAKSIEKCQVDTTSTFEKPVEKINTKEPCPTCGLG